MKFKLYFNKKKTQKKKIIGILKSSNKIILNILKEKMSKLLQKKIKQTNTLLKHSKHEYTVLIK